jgi:hypothetical protein
MRAKGGPVLHEIVAYIHGVTPRGQKDHRADYDTLHKGLQRHNPKIPDDYCGAEWGWDPTNGQGRSHQLLDKAEEELGQRALDAVHDHTDFTLNPLRIAIDKFRGLMMFNFADMFYYVSQDGKNAVRYALAETILEHLHQQGVNLDPGGDAVSLTLLGHSAGSVVAFDFLFALFYAPRQVKDFIAPEKVQSGPSQKGPAAVTAPNVTQTLNDLQRLKDMADAGNLRVRRLFTFGSPITMTAFRSDPLLEILSRDNDPTRANRIDAAQYGLTRNDPAFGPPLAGPRWVNLWDKDDPIAWPVEPLVKQAGNEVIDVYVDVSDSVTTAHGQYWANDKCHKEFARRW